MAALAAMAMQVAPVYAAENAAQSARFQPVGAAHSFKGAPGVYESTYQAIRGPSPFDRIALHRVSSGPDAPAHPGIVVLYLPGTNMNGEVAIDDQRYSLPLYMAAHGVDFWALDYRTHFVPPTTPVADLGELKGWSNQLFESDIDVAMRFVMATTGQRKIVLAGFSRGVSFAYLYAAMHPEKVAGLILFDGWIPHHKAIEPLPARIIDDIGGKHLTYDKRKQLLELVITNPNAPAPLPKYK
ncbi:MAG: alpha/beta hydrolase, partial [Candidatus Binataceae bacterium]